jgi:electron transport complex protein RnfC
MVESKENHFAWEENMIHKTKLEYVVRKNRSEKKDFLNPTFAYYPLKEKNSEYIPCVQIGDEVKIGDIVLVEKNANQNRFSLPIRSSVSGKVTSLTKVLWNHSFQKVNMLEIENDFKNEMSKKSSLQEIPTSNWVELVKQAGIIGMGGAGFPTFAKYENQKIETIIVNAVECEPYLSCDLVTLSKRMSEIIQAMQLVLSLTHARVAYLAVKSKHKQILELAEEKLKLARFPQIRIFPTSNGYPAGWEKSLVEEITQKKYVKYPIEVGVVVNNVQTILAMQEAIKTHLPATSRLITIASADYGFHYDVRILVGTTLKEVLSFLNVYLPSQVQVILGGPMTGFSQASLDVVLGLSTSGVLIFEPKKQLNHPDCMGCGRCSHHCPAGLTPTEIVFAYRNEDVKNLGDLKVNQCIQCGLCAYVCPSHLEVTTLVGLAKKMYLKDKERRTNE